MSSSSRASSTDTGADSDSSSSGSSWCALLHEAYGTWREKSMYGKTYMGTLRSTFVISPDGTLRWVRYKVSPKGHVEQLMSDLNVV